MKLPLQDTERVKSGLRDAISLLCKTGLNFQTELNISGLLGITLDHNEVLLVDIKEVIKNTMTEALVSKEDRRRRKSSTVTRLRNIEHVQEEDSDSEQETQYAKRTKLDTDEESSHMTAESNGPVSVTGAQRFVRNTELWFPESEAQQEKLPSIPVVQPTADFEENVTSRPSSKNSAQSASVADDGSIQDENQINNVQSNDTQKEIDLSKPNEHNSSDTSQQQQKGRKISSIPNKTLEQAINKLNKKQHGNNDIQANDSQDDDKPINLSSRSTSRTEAKAEDLSVKEEANQDTENQIFPSMKEEPHHDAENQVFPPILPLFPGGEALLKPPAGLQTAPPFTEPEMHARWLQNIAAHVQSVVHPPQLLGQSNIPVTLPNTKPGHHSPVLPETALNIPYVLNTPKLHNINLASGNSPQNLSQKSASVKAMSKSPRGGCSQPLGCMAGAPAPGVVGPVSGSGSKPTSPSSSSGQQHSCTNCGSDKTTTWRRMPSGQLVCNPCGLYYRLYKGRVLSGRASCQKQASGPSISADTGSRSSGSGGGGGGSNNQAGSSQRCSNCGTGVTTMWRRNAEGEPVCNACGLYYKLHKVNRPLSMVKSEIHSRRRKPRSMGGGSTPGTPGGNLCYPHPVSPSSYSGSSHDNDDQLQPIDQSHLLDQPQSLVIAEQAPMETADPAAV